MKKGRIILIEGTDGSGKKTQTKKLVERLKLEKIPVATMSFPNYETPTGRIIGECYLGKNGTSWFQNPTKLNPKIASLYYIADRLNSKEKIEEIVSSGTNLILDRYVESNMAHQGGKLKGKERDEFISWVKNLEYKLNLMPQPDAIIFLYVPTEVAIKLREQRNEIPDAHEANFKHLKNAEETYLELAEKFKWRKINCAPNGKIRHRESIAEEVYQCLGL